MNQEEYILVMILNLKLRRSNLCDYADTHILVNGRITITGARNDGAARRVDERDKGITFKIVHHLLNA